MELTKRYVGVSTWKLKGKCALHEYYYVDIFESV